jgi:hypothetical protein
MKLESAEPGDRRNAEWISAPIGHLVPDELYVAEDSIHVESLVRGETSTESDPGLT